MTTMAENTKKKECTFKNIALDDHSIICVHTVIKQWRSDFVDGYLQFNSYMRPPDFRFTFRDFLSEQAQMQDSTLHPPANSFRIE